MIAKQVKSTIKEAKTVIKNQYFLGKKEDFFLNNGLKINDKKSVKESEVNFCFHEDERDSKSVYLTLNFVSDVGFVDLNFHLNSKELFVSEHICESGCEREEMNGIILGEGRKNLLQKFLNEFISQKKCSDLIGFDYQQDNKQEQEKLFAKAINSLEESIKECDKELEKDEPEVEEEEMEI